MQRLNRIQAKALHYVDEVDPHKDHIVDNRVSSSYWQTFPAFNYQSLPLADTLGRAVPALGTLLAWLVALAALLWHGSRRLETVLGEGTR